MLMETPLLVVGVWRSDLKMLRVLAFKSVDIPVEMSVREKECERVMCMPDWES